MNKTWESGSWMQTHSGRKFFPLNPQPEDIVIEDIAHALAHICRYGGHINTHYSVAQHSVLVASCLPDDLALTGLLHDATEAYLGDVVRPLKVLLPDYQAIEDNLSLVIGEKFGVQLLPMPALVKEMDTRILSNERAALFDNQLDWALDALSPAPLNTYIRPWTAQTAKATFLRAFEELS